MYEDNFKLKGHVRIFEKDGENWNKLFDQDNLVVTRGKEFVVRKITSSGTDYIQYFGVGSSLIGATVSDIDLNGKINITSAAAPHKAYTSLVDSGTKVTLQLDLDSLEPTTQPINLSEVGLFTAISGGSMICKVVHTPITKNNTAELRYLYDLEVL
jgi:hypothetical protein